MNVQLTNAGAALLDANTGPITVTSFQLGTAFGYIPSPSDTAIHGTLVYTGVPSAPVAVNANVVKYGSYLDYDLGSFVFGEIGLFVGTTLFALATGDTQLYKIAMSSLNDGNSIRIDIYLSMVSQNYEMWLDLAESSNQFRMAVIGSVDQLPPPQDATPNAYIVDGSAGNQSAFLAYTNRAGLWNFDAYAFANQVMATITGFDFQSVTIALSDYVTGMSPEYLGQVILEFSTGALYGICRYVSTAVISGGSVTLGFDNPLMLTPILGDKFIVFGRQQLSTTIVNLPIATTTALGGVIIGTSLTVNSQGLINVNPTSYPVTSVNGRTGDVVVNAGNLPGLAAVAITGQYSSLSGTPSPYVLPVATTASIGGVKGPSDGNLTIAGDGTIDLGFSPVKTVNGAGPDGSGNVVVVATTIGLINPQQIVNGTDFNTIRTTGLYFALDADASSFINAPNVLVGGTLDVEPLTITATGGDVIQRYQQAGALYFRRYSFSALTWSAWSQVSTTLTLPVATATVLGAVMIGAGINVTGGGTISTVIQTVNGFATTNVVLAASDVGAIPVASKGAAGGVAELNATAVTPIPATDPYTYGRVPFFEATLGTWWNAGTWDANANHVAQTGASSSTPDTFTSLLAAGQQHIDISYNGTGTAGLSNPDYQTVSGEGMVYRVVTAGTTSLDGQAQWDVGDLVVAVAGLWTKITVNFENVVFSAGTF
jgi:hypothetical protein